MRVCASHGWTLPPASGLIQDAMNTSLIKSVPQGDFADISVLMRGWESQVHTLISQNRPIKFDMYPRPGIPQEIQTRLHQQGYSDLIPENDRWQHYLIPSPERPL
jgi:hypothetical protein